LELRASYLRSSYAKRRDDLDGVDLGGSRNPFGLLHMRRPSKIQLAFMRGHLRAKAEARRELREMQDELANL
jgi:hypothetical protein